MRSVSPGEVLAEKYRIENVLGEGGMGIVVAATNLALGQRVALKFVLPSAIGGQDTLPRFQREARAASKIQSEHVARVLDAGTLDDDSPFIVMEYLNGSDLGQVLKAKGPLPIEDAVDYILQACEAVAEAHSLGIVHRDLKPANLFLTQRADRSPLVKVLDFGISKIANPDEDAGVTTTQAMVGSPSYMSPEQIRCAKQVDARTDIWSLGVTLYELLAGALPFGAGGPSAVIAKIIGDPPQSLRDKRPEVSPELEAAVLRSLEKDVSKRFANVAEFARALKRFGSRASEISVDRISNVLLPDGFSTLPEPTTAEQPAPSAQTHGAVTRDPEHRKPTSKVLWTVTGAIAVAGLAVGAGLWLRSPAPHAAEAPAVSASVRAAPAPSQSATARTYVLLVGPPGVEVTVDGLQAVVHDGGVELSGPPGALRTIVARLGSAEVRRQVSLAENGVSPSRLEVVAESGLDAGARPASAQGRTVPVPSRSAPAQTTTTQPTQPQIERNKDEFGK